MSAGPELERRAATLRSLDGVVTGMKAYAGATIRKTERLIPGVRAFEEALLDALADLAPCCGGLFAPSGEGGGRIIVALGSSQGLCGAFNERVAAGLAAELRDGDRVVVIGRRLRPLLEARSVPIAGFHEAVVSVNAIGPALREIVQPLMADFAGGRAEGLAALYGWAEGPRSGVRLEPILPPDPGRVLPRGGAPEPPATHLPPRVLLEEVLLDFLGIGLHRAYLESIRCENWHRVRSLEGAADTLRRRVAEIEGQRRYLRQEEVTEEMLEILGTGMFFGGGGPPGTPVAGSASTP